MTIPIMQPPDELLLNMISFLQPRELCLLARTCTRFRSLASDETLWRKFATQSHLAIPKGFAGSIKDFVITNLTRAVPFQTVLKRAKIVTDQTVIDALKSFPQYIREIEIHVGGELPTDRTCQITGRSLREIAAKCPHLQRFSLFVSFQDQTVQLTDGDLSQFTRACPKLKTIELRGCPHVTAQGLTAMATNCTSLTSVSIASNAVSDLFVETLVKRHQNLEVLELEAVSDHVTDTSLNLIETHGKKLRLLHLKIFNKPFSKGCIEKFLSSNAVKTLEDFTLIGCRKVSNKIVALASKLPNLRALYLGGCSEVKKDDLKTISKNAPQLTKLVLSNCHKVTDLEQAFSKLRLESKFTAVNYHSFSD